MKSIGRSPTDAPGIFLYWLQKVSIRNISRSPLWSSWFISSLISYASKEYKQKSSVELPGSSLQIPYISDEEYKQKSSVQLLAYFLTDFIHVSDRNMSRSPLWSSWCICPLISYILIQSISRSLQWSPCSISLLILCTFNKYQKQKPYVELLASFRNVFIYFQWGI